MITVSRCRWLMLFLLGAFLLAGCQSKGPDVSTQVSACNTVTQIEGVYDCAGECIVTNAAGNKTPATDPAGNKTLVAVSGETSTVKRFPGATKELYQVDIAGASDFHEVEIGALAGLTLRTATAKVSNGQFPVLEEYVFETDPACKALGYTKIVRNPTEAQFKACAIHCRKKPS